MNRLRVEGETLHLVAGIVLSDTELQGLRQYERQQCELSVEQTTDEIPFENNGLVGRWLLKRPGRYLGSRKVHIEDMASTRGASIRRLNITDSRDLNELGENVEPSPASEVFPPQADHAAYIKTLEVAGELEPVLELIGKDARKKGARVLSFSEVHPWLLDLSARIE